MLRFTEWRNNYGIQNAQMLSWGGLKIASNRHGSHEELFCEDNGVARASEEGGVNECYQSVADGGWWLLGVVIGMLKPHKQAQVRHGKGQPATNCARWVPKIGGGKSRPGFLPASWGLCLMLIWTTASPNP
jgi:hypothetical protein